MSADVDAVVAEIGEAALQLRRLWAKPQILRRLRETRGPGKAIQVSNLMVIHAVAQMGEEREDVTIGAIAERLDVDPSTASRLVGHAIDAGFVSRQASPVDARRANLRLTDGGRQVKRLSDEVRDRFIAQLVADWTDAERTQFARLLRRFSDAAAAVPLTSSPADRIFEAARRTTS